MITIARSRAPPTDAIQAMLDAGGVAVEWAPWTVDSTRAPIRRLRFVDLTSTAAAASSVCVRLSSSSSYASFLVWIGVTAPK
jgi:hypothetical protein